MEAYLNWAFNLLPLDMANGLRIGQSYMNRLGVGSNPALYYETDPAKCWLMINAIESKKDD